MTYRKTWFSYVLWVVYTMLCVIFLVFAGNYICISCLIDYSGHNNMSLSLGDSTVQILGLLAVPLAAMLYWTIRGIVGLIQRKYTGKKLNRWILEGIAVWIFLALGIFFRMEQAFNVIELQNKAGAVSQAYINGMEYFDMAVVRPGASVAPTLYSSAYLYVACLSFVLSFLGNKAASAVMFQVFLQIVGLVLAYVVTKRIAGRLPACGVLLYLACSPAYLEMLKNLGPECLFFVLYLVGMLAVISLVKWYCIRQPGRKPLLAGAVGTGVLIGALGYLDLAAATILIPVTAIATGKKSRPEAEEADIHSGKMNAAVIAAVILGCAVGFLTVTAVFSVSRGTDFLRELEDWGIFHVWNTRTFGFLPLYPYSLDMLLFGALAVMASFLVFEFFRSGREQNYMLWILLCIVAAPTPLAVFGVQPFGVLSMYIWGVLAGLGLQNCIFGCRTRIMKDVIEEINLAAEEAAEIEETATTEADHVPESSGIKEEINESLPDKAAEEPPKPRYLDNPLPLPRKHVRRQMEYQYVVDEKDMEYDIEVSEDDDFDI